MQSFLNDDEPESLFQNRRASTPSPRFKRPKVLWDTSGPVWILIDAMGNEHRIKDGASLTDARFEGYDLSGILWTEVTLETVSFANCRLSNWELQNSTLRQVLIQDCVGGPVFKDCEIYDNFIERINDERATVRFFRCSIKMLTLSHLTSGLEISRSTGEDILVESCVLKGIVILQFSDLTKLCLSQTSVANAHLRNMKLIDAEFVEVSFSQGQWQECDLSVCSMRDVEFDRVQIKGLRLDLAELVAINFWNVRADDVTSVYSEWSAIQITGAAFSVTFEDSFLYSVMWHKVIARIALIRTRCLGIRLTDVYGTIRGECSELYRPVIRRSILEGDGKRGITMIGADVTTTLVTHPFGSFIEPLEKEQS